MLTLISFIVVMSVIVFVHELGHLIVAKRNKIVVEEFGFGFPPRVIKLFERGGTLYSINAIPFGGFARMRGEDDPSLAGSFASASKLARVATLLAGASFNFIFAILLFAILSGLGGVPDQSKPGAVVLAVSPGSPAASAGLLPGDRLTAADGNALLTVQDLQDYTRDHAGERILYTAVRTDASGVEAAQQLAITPRLDPPDGEGFLGVGVGPALRAPLIWEAAWDGVRRTGEIIYLTFSIPVNLIREGKPLGDAGFMGPIGIAATTGQVVGIALQGENLRQFLQIMLQFMALLSTALGVTNLLPLPALDGGRLMFVLAEALRGKRVDPAQEGLVHLIGLGLLLVLVAAVSVREIGALVTGTFPTIGVQ